MYKFLPLFLILFFIDIQSDAQYGIFFQAIARDNFNNPAKDRKIFVQSNIIQTSQSGKVVFIEEHQTNTDATGIFNIMVGNGIRVGGSIPSFNEIDWAQYPYYLNIKIAITPIGASNNWDYSKEWMDIGTSIFGVVPFALYSANTAHINDKLNTIDTSKMLSVYAKGKTVQILSTLVDTKLSIKDTLTMLLPYSSIKYTDSALRTKFNITDTIKFAKKIYTDSALLSKMNLEDTIKYAKLSYTDAALNTKLNISDTIKFAKKNYTDSALLSKMNLEDTIKYAKQLYTDAALLTKLSLTDTIRYTKKSYTDSVLSRKINLEDTIKYAKLLYTDSALLTKLTITGSAAGLTNFPLLNQNTTGNAATANNITAAINTSLTSLSNLNTVGTITTGIWSATTIDIAHGGTGLMNAGSNGQVLTSTASGTLSWTNASTLYGAHFIGENYGGGIVFYVFDNGKHGLIVSTEDQSTGGVNWYNGVYSTTNAVRDGINAGLMNTERIIISQGTGNYAAQIAANYKGGGYGDWYLPSAYELGLLHLQRQLFFTGSNVIYYYYSSNENPTNNRQVMCYRFTSTLYSSYLDKLNTQVRVRAIRAF